MSGFSAFLAKELQEIRRTWRIWVIPGLLLFFAVASPLLAYLTPALVGSMIKSQPGVSVTLPPATWRDAYAQFLRNLSQIVVIAIVITGAGSVSGERATGTAVLTLVKPVSRASFVLAKVASQWILVAASAALGTVICAALTRAIFGPAPVGQLVSAVLLWLAYALLLVIVMTLFSAWFPARGAAAGAGLGFYFLTALAGIWAPLVRYSFVGLLPAAGKTLLGQSVATAWPLATTAIADVLCAAVAVRVFGRQEL